MRGNHKWQTILRADIAKAVQIARDGYSYEDLGGLVLDPSPAEFGRWVNDYLEALSGDVSTKLAFDIETPGKRGRDEDDLDESDPSYTILRCSFAYGPLPGHTASIPWEPAYLAAVHRALGSNGCKLVWNGSYDVPRIEAAGIQINGEIRDSQVAWHVSNSDLRKKLGIVATLCPSTQRIPMWKHLSQQEPAYYNAIDSLVTWRIDEWVMQSLVDLKMDHIFREQVADVDPIMRNMTRIGMLFDQEAAAALHKRAEDVLGTLRKRMNEAAPPEIKPKKIYKRPAPDTVATLQAVMVKMCSKCGKERINKKHPCLKEAGAEITKVERQGTAYVQTLDFTPSPKQLIAYCKFKQYPLSINRKTKNYTMDEDALDKLLRKYPDDPLLIWVGKYREVQKADGTYISGVRAGADGRVHGTLGHTPSTLRTAMWNPNLQNIPRPGEGDSLYTCIRNLYVAGEGMVLGARDYSGIEAVITGYCMQDPVYIRLAKLGVHAYLCSHLVGEPAALHWSDDDLRAWFRRIKKQYPDQYFVAKKVVHLSNYAGTPAKMWEAEPEIFHSAKEAAKYQDIYFGVVPKLKKWHLDLCERAEKTGYVRAPDGFVHRFHNLFRYEYVKGSGWTKLNKKGEPMYGEDAKRAIAFQPQHMAAVYMKQSMVSIAREAPDLLQWLRLTIHDELLWECPQDLIDEVDFRVKEVMERPCKYMPLPTEWGMGDFLTIGTEGKRGYKWGEMR
jgi:DNA polymerase I-like protein with 3'-5' exonuclease and polymerase domains